MTLDPEGPGLPRWPQLSGLAGFHRKWVIAKADRTSFRPRHRMRIHTSRPIELRILVQQSASKPLVLEDLG